MPLAPADFENQFAIRRLKNQTQSGEGAILPPRLLGPGRVPIVTGLKVIKVSSYFGGTEITLAWNDISDGISHYNIYVTGLLEKNSQPLGPYTARRSPAVVRVQGTVAARVAFIVQTVLLNGQVSNMATSPSVTGQTVAPFLAASDIPLGTIPVGALQNGTPGDLISWSPAGTAVTTGAGTAGQILVAQSLNVPVWTNPQAVNLEKVRNLTAGTYSADDSTVYLCDCSGGAITVNLGAVASAARRRIDFKKVDSSANTLTVAAAGAETIDGAATQIIAFQYDSMQIFPSTEWRIV